MCKERDRMEIHGFVCNKINSTKIEEKGKSLKKKIKSPYFKYHFNCKAAGKEEVEDLQGEGIGMRHACMIHSQRHRVEQDKRYNNRSEPWVVHLVNTSRELMINRHSNFSSIFKLPLYFIFGEAKKKVCEKRNCKRKKKNIGRNNTLRVPN
jgi:hypothetical protein